MNNIKNYNSVSSLLDLPIKELQNISVNIFDEEKFIEVYEYGNVLGQMDIYNKYIKGCFIRVKCPDFITIPSIMIIEGMSIENQIFTFFHEYGHYQCYNNGCSCLDFRLSSERHAWRNSFKLMFYYKCYKSLVIALRVLNNYKKYTNDKSYINDVYHSVITYERPLFRQVEKWVKNCPKKYKNNLIRID